MSATPRGAPFRFLSRGAREELGALQASVHELGAHRSAALRIFLASRYAATAMAQRDFWLEFSWADQEYRVAVRRLAKFCFEHRESFQRANTGPLPSSW